METITQWAVSDLSFEAGTTLDWRAFPLTVAFEKGDLRLILDGFWDGGRTWRVRFALPEPGEWRWRSEATDSAMDGREGRVQCVAPSAADVAGNPNYRGHLRISDNGHHFTYADGTPFLYLGDTCWEMNEARCGLGRNSDGPFYRWLEDRKRKGFTVVNHWIFASGHPKKDQETPSLNEGGLAFELEDGLYVFDRLLPPYYRYVDARWQALWENGFVMAGPPTWFCKPTHHADLEQAQRISRYLMARYGAFNLVWALSGEYSFGAENPPWDDAATWNQLGSHLAAHNPYRHPMSIHPGPANQHASSSIDFHNEAWLDHNWLQTGQYRAGLHRVAVWAAADRDRTPTRPVLQAEGFYEGNPGKKGATSFQARYQPWTAFLNGACGAVYGADAIWSFHDPADPRSYNWRDTMDWRDGIALPGSTHVGHVAGLLRSIEWWKLEPQRDRILLGGIPAPMPTETDVTPPHCAGLDGACCVVYIPQGNASASIALTKLPAASCTGRWYDPRTGQYQDIEAGGRLAAGDEGRFLLPPRPEPADEDWVCLITAVR